MRVLFFVGAKLLGIFLIYNGLVYAGSALSMGEGGSRVVVMYALFVVLSLSFGLVLAFRTEALAKALGAGSDPEEMPLAFEAADGLRTGIILIGLYVLVTRTGRVMSLAGVWLTENLSSGIGRSMIGEMVPVVIALLFVFRPDGVVGLVTRFSRKPLASGVRSDG